MIIQFHTPKGIIPIDSESPTLNEELTALGVTREAFEKLLPEPERDLAAEIDKLKGRIEKLEKK